MTYHLLRIVSVGLHIIIEVWPHGALGDGCGLIGFWVGSLGAVEDCLNLFGFLYEESDILRNGTYGDKYNLKFFCQYPNVDNYLKSIAL